MVILLFPLIWYMRVLLCFDCLQPHGLFATLLSMEFPRQEYGSGLPFPPLGDIPNPGIEPELPASPALPGGFCTAMPPGGIGTNLWLLLLRLNLCLSVVGQSSDSTAVGLTLLCWMSGRCPRGACGCSILFLKDKKSHTQSTWGCATWPGGPSSVDK